MGEVILGTHTYRTPIARRGDANTITIGNYTSIAIGVIFDSGFNHNTHSVSTYPFHLLDPTVLSNIVVRGDISIGSDCWIGENAVIMSGVTIGDGAVIGMRCIVSKDVAPYEIVVGAPQKVLRKRFTDGQIEELLKIKWWDWPEEKVIANAHLFQSNDIENFLSIHKTK